MMKPGKTISRQIINFFFNPYRINDSLIYSIYLRLRHPRHYAKKAAEASFYAQIISGSGGGLVFDVGANSGSKAVIFAKSATHVVCVEPSPLAVDMLKQRFSNQRGVSIVAQGVGACAGSFPFYMFGEADCYNTFSGKWADNLGQENDQGRPAKEAKSVVDVRVTTLDSLIHQYGRPSYIKIDVEGFELEVLKGLTTNVKMISLECNLPEFEKETLECLARLDLIQSEPRFNYCTTEPPVEFASRDWLSHSEMVDVIVARRHRFMEVYSMATG